MTCPHLPVIYTSITQKKKNNPELDTLQKTSKRHTPNGEYRNFVTAHSEAVEE